MADDSTVPDLLLIYLIVDGDGRADYLTIDEKSGAVSAWLNNGPKAAWTWKSVGQVRLPLSAISYPAISTTLWSSGDIAL